MKNTLKIIAVIIGVVLLDQITKGFFLHMIIGRVPLFGAACDLIPPFCVGNQIFHGADFMNLWHTSWFKFVFVWNPGTSFSLFRNLGESAPLIIIILSGFIIGAIGYYLFTRAKPGLEKWSLALIVGGALGNLIDRIRFGAVIDFLDFHVKNWHWPAFNFADICISVGVGLIILGWVFGKKNC